MFLELYYTREMNIKKEVFMNSKIKRLGWSKKEFKERFGGILDIFYQSTEWAIRSAEILKRDKFTCQICGKKPANTVHHIRSVWYHPEMALDPRFLITVCKQCHYEIHK